ncbi:HNH endonuclease [Gordonia phage RedWattleHog]|nr:HNH endonuclease [Gordonia phage RedWattleHog]
MTAERWLPVPGYEDLYEVSDRGRVRSIPRTDALGRRVAGGMRSTHTDDHGRIRVTLNRDGGKKGHLVHHLVLEAFVGPCPDGLECCHWNGDASDNRLANLRWDTSAANKMDNVRNGTHHYARRATCPNGHLLIDERPGDTKRRICRACAAGQEAVRRGTASSVKDYADNFLRKRGLDDWIVQ